MRSRYAIPYDQIPSYPDQRKKTGYYIANGGKTDYNIGSRDNKEVWGGSEKGDWSQGKEGQLFFTVVPSSRGRASELPRPGSNIERLWDSRT